MLCAALVCERASWQVCTRGIGGVKSPGRVGAIVVPAHTRFICPICCMDAGSHWMATSPRRSPGLRQHWPSSTQPGTRSPTRRRSPGCCCAPSPWPHPGDMVTGLHRRTERDAPRRPVQLRRVERRHQQLDRALRLCVQPVGGGRRLFRGPGARAAVRLEGTGGAHPPRLRGQPSDRRSARRSRAHDVHGGGACGRSFQATSLAMERLVDAGVLVQVSVGRRNRAFEAHELVDAFTAFERRLASPEGDTRTSTPARRVPGRPAGNRS